MKVSKSSTKVMVIKLSKVSLSMKVSKVIVIKLSKVRLPY